MICDAQYLSSRANTYMCHSEAYYEGAHLHWLYTSARLWKALLTQGARHKELVTVVRVKDNIGSHVDMALVTTAVVWSRQMDKNQFKI